MATYKGGFFLFLRNRLKGHPELEAKFRALLTADEMRMYEVTLPSSRVDPSIAGEIMRKAASVLYPGEDQPIVKLGEEFGENSLTTIYRVLLKTTSVAFLMKACGRIWSQYHDKGDVVGEIDPKDPKVAYMTVKNYPDLHPAQVEITLGYGIAAMRRAGAKLRKSYYVKDKDGDFCGTFEFE